MHTNPLPDPGDAVLEMAKGSAENARILAVIFRLGPEWLAIDASAVREIALMARLSTPSGRPAVLAGFLNLAGRPIPVIRLHRLFDLPEPVYGLYTQILILRDGDGDSVGWIVDRVVHVVPVREAEIMAVPENECFMDCTKGVFTYGDANVSIIAPQRVLLEKERQCISEFRNVEQTRLRELEQPVA
jgi:purine-binding chemotaxis protein CheW